MEGYSVTEAASVLGVPTERVWELLARGVLAGTPEGDTGMRVFLQPRPAPAPAEPTPSNGYGGRHEPEPEASPFRELLTEFRNLTERYGQALLALGEARGEVASLRSRVDVLEARMDLRLPGGSGPMPPWAVPLADEQRVSPTMGGRSPSAAAPEAPADVDDETSSDDVADHGRNRRRGRGRRKATESFAEALARAEDPSPPELPPASDSGATPAAPREAGVVEAEAALPRELPAAEPMPTAEEPMLAAEQPLPTADEPTAIAAEFVPVEPTPPAEEPAPVAAEGPSVGESPAADEPAAIEEAESRAGPEPDVTAAADAGPAETPSDAIATGIDLSTPEAPAREAPMVDPAPPPEPGTAAAAADALPEPAVSPEPNGDVGEPAGAAWSDERYTARIDEPDWLAEEDLTLDQSAWEPMPPRVEAVPAEPPAASTTGANEPSPEPNAPVAPRDDADEDDDDSAAAAQVVEAAPGASPTPPPADPSGGVHVSRMDAEPEPAREDPAAPQSAAGREAAQRSERPATAQPAATTYRDEETILWLNSFPGASAATTSDDDAAEMEVASSGSGTAQQRHDVGHAELPGSRELDEAMAALDALTRRPAGGSEPTKPATGTTDRGPASRAYRRLRRIFPG